jgi:putative sterol carrier protein
MAQPVSNDARWEKLSAVDKTLENIARTQKSLIPEDNQSEIKIDLKKEKDEIISNIEQLEKDTEGVYKIRLVCQLY